MGTVTNIRPRGNELDQDAAITRKEMIKQYRKAANTLLKIKTGELCVKLALILTNPPLSYKDEEGIGFDLTIFNQNKDKNCTINFHAFERTSKVTKRLDNALLHIKNNDFAALNPLSREL